MKVKEKTYCKPKMTSKIFASKLKYLLALMIASHIGGCRSNEHSNTNDIGVVNTQDATSKVLYADQGKVYLKTCKPPLAAPLTRYCATDEMPKDLDVSVYLDRLPFEVGPYQRDTQGLAFVTKALEDAKEAEAGGNQNAAQTVQRLTPIKLNLEKILSVQDKLQANQNGSTYYEYQEEFSKLLEPFGESAGGTTSISGMNFIPVPGQSFAMQETEVTRGQWKALMGYYPEENDASCKPKVLNDDHPVSCVSARDAERFANEMTRKNHGHTYRLPSEQEWATAAGNINGPVFGWCTGTSTHPVKKRKSHNGLYDMVGNVWEWTSSNYDSFHRVIRGGRWGSNARHCRASNRSGWRPDDGGDDVGFRLLRQP